MAAPASVPVEKVLFDAKRNRVNLYNVTTFVVGDSRNAAAKCRSQLSSKGWKNVPQTLRPDCQNPGKEILVGTCKDGVELAKALGASEDKLERLRSHFGNLANVDVSIIDPEARQESEEQTETEGQPEVQVTEVTSGDGELVLPPKSFVVECISSCKLFPVEFTEELAVDFLGYSSYKKGVEALKRAMNLAEFLDEVHVGERHDVNGVVRDRYTLTVRGLKKLGMRAGTARGEKLREYFIEVEVRLPWSHLGRCPRNTAPP